MDGTGPESLQHFIDACLGQPYYPGADAHVGLKVRHQCALLYPSTLVP